MVSEIILPIGRTLAYDSAIVSHSTIARELTQVNGGFELILHFTPSTIHHRHCVIYYRLSVKIIPIAFGLKPLMRTSINAFQPNTQFWALPKGTHQNSISNLPPNRWLEAILKKGLPLFLHLVCVPMDMPLMVDSMDNPTG
jgi:hypothetical protein